MDYVSNSFTTATDGLEDNTSRIFAYDIVCAKFKEDKKRREKKHA